MEKFIPNTTTINKDRSYYIDGANFIKKDENPQRGHNEAIILSMLKNYSFAPKFINLTYENECSVITMSLIDGHTLENLKLNVQDKIILFADLMLIIGELIKLGISHNDINESNIMFDIKNKKTYLIDFETAKIDNSLNDLSDYRGLMYIKKYLEL